MSLFKLHTLKYNLVPQWTLAKSQNIHAIPLMVVFSTLLRTKYKSVICSNEIKIEKKKAHVLRKSYSKKM